MLRRGDIISLKGFPHRTRRGELSVVLSELPHILSPCLHPLPTELLNRETKIRHRYVDFLVNPRTAHILRLKAAVIEYLRSYLAADGQVEIQTPILADEAGGAVARPFQTSATEFPDRELSLRIAPELWLKRLVIGGFDRVFEIGPSFRNEGLDSTHNPEFTTCEFYRTYTDLEDLMNLTENLLLGIATHVAQASADLSFTLNRPAIKFADKFARLDFVSGIEAATNRSLPSFKSPDALGQVARYLQECSMQLPANPTLPRLLDHLSSQLLEPQCMQPTWITNYPECLSPLAKSIDHPTRNQRVSARAELFVNGQEIVNTYEEENSPFEQRRKFVEQLEYRADGNDKKIDEEYLAALEWGLPPTGGWGCGVDRLTMLMLGTERIGDVLSFGNLRNVVASRRTP
ncbi:MAG: hypothetical protein MMC33_010417 [Icmadophila ericetorum]|nr:hypothetical protein [Icmadophila ericetorum]